MKFLVSFRHRDPADRASDEWFYFRRPFDASWLNFSFTDKAHSPTLDKCDCDRVLYWQRGRPEWHVRVEQT